MLKLASNDTFMSGFAPFSEPEIFRLSTDANRPRALREKEFFLSNDGHKEGGFRGTVFFGSPKDDSYSLKAGSPIIVLSDDFNYLDDGDILRVEPEARRVRVLFRRSANQNSFLLTERCNHYCLMCSQPPKNIEDGWIVDELIEVMRLMPQTTHEIGFTGGEPTLLEDRFLELIRSAKSYLPQTALHVLTNGRRFEDPEFCRRVQAENHHDLMFGIPLYSDVSSRHNYIVQAENAFDETVKGIINLNRHGQKVEVRIVLHKQSIGRLRQLSEFICRNLTFVDHVALMGLEVTGFARANLDDLWVDPYDYQNELAEAALYLEAANMVTSIYNLQLCILAPEVWHLARNSISDWKNDFVSECEACSLRDKCGGLFSTGMTKFSDHISAFLSEF
jgi:His-Xaa-Ser system radical SAM maturase HxsC